MTPAEIRAALNRPVRFTNAKLYVENAEYILTGAVFRKDKKTGEFYYQAELADPTTENSVIYCRLEEIENDE
ncbi:MAG: hypothetical protein IIZ73_10540 [Ruminococcus sp.]|nr:hypothetical protein [Ruminococcus sp.]